jgi:hypothetical protein
MLMMMLFGGEYLKSPTLIPIIPKDSINWKYLMPQTITIGDALFNCVEAMAPRRATISRRHKAGTMPWADKHLAAQKVEVILGLHKSWWMSW